MAITYVKDIPDFNKKVNELTDITDVKDDIEDIQEDITDIQGDITEIQGDVTEVQGDVSTLAGAVTALDGEVDEIKETESYTITQPFTPPYNSNYTLKRYGKIVSFLIEGLWISSITADTDAQIATVPTELLPTNNITWATPLLDGNGDVKGYARAYINKSNGALIIKSSSSLSGNLGIQGNLMWFI